MNESGWVEGAIFITALAALASAVTSIVQVRRQDERARLQLGINNLWSLIQQWDAPEMRTLRSRLARRLLEHPEARGLVSPDATEILNMFELLGYLVVRSETLRLEDAWTNFSPWVMGWWYVLEDGIEALRANDHTVFEDYRELLARMENYDLKRSLPIATTEEQMRFDEIGFLRDEEAIPGGLIDLPRSTSERFWALFRRTR